MNKIDLSAVVGSKVLCEFWDSEEDINYRDFLTQINQVFYFSTQCEIGYKHCHILQDYWHSNHDGSLVLPDGLKIECAFRDGRVRGHFITGHNIPLDRFNHFGTDDDIIAVCVIGPDENWEY